jgi:hypothetical protein
MNDSASFTTVTFPIEQQHSYHIYSDDYWVDHVQ